MTRSQKILTGVFFGLPILCCLGGGIYVQRQINSVGAGLDAEVQRLRKKGIATTPEELRRSVDPRENAAKLYRQAMNLFPPETPEHQKLEIVAKAAAPSATETQEKEAAANYAAMQEVIGVIEAATTRPFLDFDRDWSKGVTLEFPEYSELRHYQRLLSYKAKRQSKAGDFRGALETVDRMFKLSDHAGQEGTLIGMFVQIATETIAHDRLRQVSKAHASNPAALSAARSLSESLDRYPDFRRAIETEIVLGRAAIHHLGEFSLTFAPDEEPSRLEKSMLGNRTLRRALDRKFVEAYGQFIDQLPQDPNDWKGAADAAAKFEADIEKDKSLLAFTNQILIPFMGTAAKSLGRPWAQRRMSVTAIRLMQDKAATGAFPPKLPDYGQYVIDPFSEKPFLYKPTKTGFLLYSVDVDGKDDGGKRSGSGGRDLVSDLR